MNPADLLFRTWKHSLDSGLITLASKSANGKTLLCNSIFYHFLQNNVNVIMFRDTNINLCSPSFKFESKGIIVDHFGFNPAEDLERFNRVVQKYSHCFKNNTVIIVDAPMFLHNSDFELYYENIKQNTRYVIFEKTNDKLRYKIERLRNRTQFEKTRQNIQSLTELSFKFKVPIILTTQLRRISGVDDNVINQITPTLAYSSNMIITSEKSEHNSTSVYTLKVLKSRYSSENEMVVCKFNKTTHSLVTI